MNQQKCTEVLSVEMFYKDPFTERCLQTDSSNSAGSCKLTFSVAKVPLYLEIGAI